MKILNLYAGIGGNRKLWPEGHEVTAVEIDTKRAAIYQSKFPQDTVIIGDAHQYLLDHYKEFDFIWSSPPCQTHSGMNNFLNPQGVVRYPDMSLWQEIIFLTHFSKVPFVVENVKAYYDFIKPQHINRHYFWANFIITDLKGLPTDIGTFNRSASQFAQKMNKKSQMERDCVNPKLGLHVLNCAFKEKQLTIELTKGVD